MTGYCYTVVLLLMMLLFLLLLLLFLHRFEATKNVLTGQRLESMATPTVRWLPLYRLYNNRTPRRSSG